jgi:hypothetical protein
MRSRALTFSILLRGAVVWTVPILLAVVALSACKSAPPLQADRGRELVAKGRQIFFNETFNGNGRTCGTCHPAENNFTIDPAFIATLPKSDPLFVAEFNPDLTQNFENPALMRTFGLIQENLDGFEDLKTRFVMRGVPHVLGLRQSVASPQGPRTGWSGDGAPGDGSLRSFAVGAVIQHFTRTLRRVPSVDFRLPTDPELDALEAFMLSLGRQQELVLPLALKGAVPKRGQEIFLDNSLGKCNLCHFNAGATANFGRIGLGNANFNTGVEDLPDQPTRLAGVPVDDGFRVPGDRTFNTPSLVEAADTGPFFHNNAIETLEAAVAFYNGPAYNNSPAGRALASTDPGGIGIRLEATQVVAVAAFLRVLNVLENIRQSLELLEASLAPPAPPEKQRLLGRAVLETDDAIRVLEGGGLHPEAVLHLHEAKRLTKAAAWHLFSARKIQEAAREQRKARDLLIGQGGEPV